MSKSDTTTTKREAVARAICKAMNINPDGYSHAHKFHSDQDPIAKGQMWTIRNWQAAEHVAMAAIEAAQAEK